MSSLIGRTCSPAVVQGRALVHQRRRGARRERARQVKIYEFDASYQLRLISAAKTAEYRGAGLWMLKDVAQTRFLPAGPRTETYAEAEWRSA